MQSKRDGELTTKQAKFAALLAQGYSQAAAYRAAYDAENMQDATIWQEGSRVARHPLVAARVRELLDEARISDLDSARRAFRDLLEDIELARAAKNWTAVAQLQRMRLQYHGLLKDRLVVSEEQPDLEAMIQRLAGDDAEFERMLREVVGSAGGFTQH